jgi:15-cis-phytoene synthase
MRQPSSDSTARLAADITACRDLLRDGSRTFFAASFLLPKKVREPASALYAFCRLADDAVDLGIDRPQAVGALRERLARAYAGQPLAISADRAFAEVVRRFAIPRAIPEALLEGFEWDAAGRRYNDLAQLHGYAARVAGSVGAMMALVMGAREPVVVARACDLGIAMQLSNIARDVGEDARRGRLYLPLSWMRDAGIDAEQWLARPVFNDALKTVVQRLLQAADQAYARVGDGIARLPSRCRPGIRTARLLYAEIGHEVARRGYDSVSQRAIVPAARKVALIVRALSIPSSDPRADVPALAETRFLVDAAAAVPWSASDHGRRSTRLAKRQRIGDRAEWLIELFERLERRDRAQRSGAIS